MLPEGKKWFQYVLEKYPEESRIAFDPTLITASIFDVIVEIGEERIKAFGEKNVHFVPL